MQGRDFSRRGWLIVVLFGLLGQIAWSVENMYFNLFVFETISPNLDAITLMVQLSGVVATVATLFSGTLSDKIGNRRSFISFGYLIWGVTVAIFGYISPESVGRLFSLEAEGAITVTLTVVILADCVMTLFGSTANDAAFNAWVTDNTRAEFRGKVEGVIAILPLVAMLIVAGGFGILASAVGYSTLFLLLGILISLCGGVGLFIIKDSPELTKSGRLRDIFYGFRPSVVKGNPGLYLSFVILLIYGIATQIYMPYLIIYMKSYLGFTVIEYSLVFGVAIAAGAAINVWLGILSDKLNKAKLLYISASVMAAGLFGMYLARGIEKAPLLILFGLGGFVMITGYIFTAALSGALVRDYTPEGEAGKLQGVRMVFSVLIPMIVGPMIGNAINRAQGNLLPDAGADAMTTSYIPAPEIFLTAAVVSLLTLAATPVLLYVTGRASRKEK